MHGLHAAAFITVGLWALATVATLAFVPEAGAACRQVVESPPHGPGRRHRRSRRGRGRDRARAVALRARPDACSRRAPTSAPAPARRTPRCCTPASTRSRGRSRRGWSRAGTGCWPTTPREHGIPVERTGALLVAWDDEQLGELPGIVERSRANGYTAIRTLDRRRALPPRAAARGGRARRARGPRRGPDLPVHDAAGLRHRGRARRLRPAPRSSRRRPRAPRRRRLPGGDPGAAR